jgi:arylsulfatase A-like enzyme
MRACSLAYLITTQVETKGALPRLQSQIQNDSLSPSAPTSLLLLVGVWFGICTGFMEGLGLLFFQRINWKQWGRMMHVSKDILWVSPLVDILFFLAVAAVVWLVSRLFKRLPALVVLVFLLTFLAAYDWLSLTDRLYSRACFLLSLGVAVAFTRWLRRHEPQAVRFWKKSWGSMVAVFVLVVVAIPGGKWIHERMIEARLPAAASGSPNVLVIVVDTLRADHLSAYGYSRPTSPQIDRIAKQGAMFENAIAPCSWSLPSHGSLITGRYPLEHGLVNVEPMPWLGWGKSSLRGYPTIGEALQKSGYRTGAFSANRVYFTDNVGLGRGFLHFDDYFFSAGDSLTRTLYGRKFARLYLNRSNKSKVTRAFRFFGLGSWLDKDSEGSGTYGGAFGVRKRASDVNQEVLGWIERGRNRPFFAFLNYLDVHYEYGGPRGYPKPEWNQGTPIDEYDAGLVYEDDYIGRLLRELEQRGVAENTIVIITSDHGESLGDHGLTYHGAALYWELVHVPLIVSYPGHIPSGVRLTPPVSISAIPAMILDLVGAKENNIFPGPPLSGFWKKSQADPKWPDPVSELPQTNIIVPQDRVVEGKVPIATNGDMETLVTPKWQLIVHQKLGMQLYDWTVDPGETRNLAETPEGHTTALELAAELKTRTKHANQ